MATAKGYTDDDRKRIVSDMQSMHDRLGGFLVNTCGDAFDGDIDTMLEAINFMKALRIDALTAVPARKSPPVPHTEHEDCNCVQVGYADGWNACRAAMLAAPAAPVEPAAAVQKGWKEAAIAWEVCASIHRKYGKGKDALFSTRQKDFMAGAEKARAMLAAAERKGE